MGDSWDAPRGHLNKGMQRFWEVPGMQFKYCFKGFGGFRGAGSDLNNVFKGFGGLRGAGSDLNNVFKGVRWPPRVRERFK